MGSRIHRSTWRVVGRPDAKQNAGRGPSGFGGVYSVIEGERTAKNTQGIERSESETEMVGKVKPFSLNINLF